MALISSFSIFSVIILALSIIEYAFLDYGRKANAKLPHVKEQMLLSNWKKEILSISPLFQIFFAQWFFPAAQLMNAAYLSKISFLIFPNDHSLTRISMQYLGFGLFCYCQVIYLWSLWTIGKYRTPALQPPLQNPILISQGLYKRIRHPLYSIACVKFCCLLLYWQSALLLLGLPGFYFLFQIATEEESWLVVHMPGYQAYQKSTRKYWFLV